MNIVRLAPSSLLHLARPALWHPSQPVEKQRRRNVERHVSKKQCDVAPALRVLDVEAFQELTCAANGTDLTVVCRVRIQEVRPIRLDVGVQVGGTSLSHRGRHLQDFNGGAHDIVPIETHGENGRHQVGEW